MAKAPTLVFLAMKVQWPLAIGLITAAVLLCQQSMAQSAEPACSWTAECDTDTCDLQFVPICFKGSQDCIDETITDSTPNLSGPTFGCTARDAEGRCTTYRLPCLPGGEWDPANWDVTLITDQDGYQHYQLVWNPSGGTGPAGPPPNGGGGSPTSGGGNGTGVAGGAGEGGGGSGTNNSASSQTSQCGDQSAGFLGKHGSAQRTSNPVLLSEGVKVESDVDLVISLPGDDFRLERFYSGGATIERSGFPWYSGRGWGTNADGWLNNRPQQLGTGGLEFVNPYPDGVEIASFPLEHSGKFFDLVLEVGRVIDPNDPQNGLVLESLVPSTTRVVAGTITLGPGFERFASSPSSMLANETYKVWIHETSGSGETLYFRENGLAGRILQRRDAFGNEWTFDYVVFPSTSPLRARPRVSRIFLHGSDPLARTPASQDKQAKAIVEFQWDLGSVSAPGSGRLRAVRSTRPGLPASINDTGLAYAKYTYTGDLWPGAADGDLLAIVERGVMINAPLAGEAITSGFQPEYRVTFTHYRYEGPKQRLTHRFDSPQIEHFAERYHQPSGGAGSGVALLRDAAVYLAGAPLSEAVSGGNGLAIQDFASKIVTYYTVESGPGYYAGEMEGLVKQELLQAGCACGAGGGQSLKQEYTYARSWMRDPDELFSTDIVNVTLAIGRWKSVTTITDWVKDTPLSEWRKDQVRKSWSEDRRFTVGPQGVEWPPFDPDPNAPIRTTIYTFNPKLMVPFVVANSVQEWTPAGPGRTWYTLHEHVGHLRVREFHPSSIQSVLLDARGCLDYPNWRDTQGPNPPEPREAFSFKSGGLISWTEYDALGRVASRGIERSSASTLPVIDQVPSQAAIHRAQTQEQREYAVSVALPDTWSTDGRRLDLVSSVTIGGGDAAQTTTFDYKAEATSPSASSTPSLRGRLLRTASYTSRAGEIGPNGSAVDWTEFDSRGSMTFSVDPSGTITRYESDPLTGATTQATRNVANTLDHTDGASVPQVYGSRSSDGQLITTIQNDISGRPYFTTNEAGLTTETRLSLESTDVLDLGAGAQASRLSYLCQTVIPHQLSDGGFSGPAVKSWVDAASNILRQSAFEMSGTGSPSLGAERARALYTYSLSGKLTQSRTWSDLALNQSFLERYEYDGRGRLARQTSPIGEVIQTTYDAMDRVIAVESGAEGAPLTLNREWFYDFDVLAAGTGAPTQGMGDGRLTVEREHVRSEPAGPVEYRDSANLYDWRGRARLSWTRSPGSPWTSAANASNTAVILDDRDRPIELVTFGQGPIPSALTTALLEDQAVALTNAALAPLPVSSRVWTLYSERGLTTAVDIEIDTAAPHTDYLRSQSEYDHSGRLIGSAPAGGPKTRRVFDGLGRVTDEAITDGRSQSFTSTGPNLSSDGIIERTQTSYDSTRGLPFLITRSFRRHDVADSIDSIGSAPVQSFLALVHDDAARVIGTVNYGTALSGADPDSYSAGGLSPISGPLSTAPPRSAPILVTETVYDSIGRPHIAVDELGRMTRTEFDDLGRASAVIENAVGQVGLSWDPSSGIWRVSNRPGPASSDRNRVTSLVYDGVGNIVKRIAHTPRLSGTTVLSEDVQVTQYVFNSSGADPDAVASASGLAALGNVASSNGLLYEIRYPTTAAGSSMGLPGAGESDIVRFAYNTAGEQIATKDQNGVIRDFYRDSIGRLQFEEVRSAPTGVDGAITGIEMLYDPFGRPLSVASFGGATGAELRNETTFEYGSLSRIKSLRQNPAGAAADQTARVAEYQYEDQAYAPGGAQFSRPKRLIYPTPTASPQTTVCFQYGGSQEIAGRISRLSTVQWPSNSASAPNVSHAYLGLNRRVASTLGVSGEPTRNLMRDTTRAALGAPTPPTGAYPGLDRFGRIKRRLWYQDSAWSPSAKPPLVELGYQYDAASNTTARMDSRPGMPAFPARNMHEVYAHDELDRVTAAIRDTNLSATTPGKGSQTWALDSLGNWLDSYSASSHSSGLDSHRTQEFNSTNEIVAADTIPGLPGGEKEFEYDAAGNLTGEQLTDSGGLQRRRKLQYDAWNRLTRISMQSRTGPGDAWANDQVLVAYSYYADHRLATRVADAVSDGQPRPTERTHYFYDSQWNLLEEHVDGGYDAQPSGPAAPWSWSDAGFSGAFSQARRLIRQYIWDPTAQDELVQIRRTTSPGSGDFIESDWVLTDRNHSMIATIPSQSNGAPSATSISPGDRIRFSAFGLPTLLARGDADFSGKADFDDQNTILARWNQPIGGPGYAASVDMDFSGVVDFNDIGALLVAWGSIDAPGACAPASRPCSIAYTGALWDPLAQMSLMRNRWQDPMLGRFITRDPAGYVDGMSLYLYSRGNPLTWFDPWGLGASDCNSRPRWHHLLPQEIREEFAATGLDIDSPEFGWLTDDMTHQEIHTAGWNDKWKRWFEAQRKSKTRITADSVRKQLMRMMKLNEFRPFFAKGVQASIAYKAWSALDYKSDYFREAIEHRNRQLSELAGKKLKGAAAKAFLKSIGIFTAAIFITIDVAEGKPLTDAVLDEVLMRDVIIELGEMGQRAVSDYVDNAVEGAHRGMRNRHSGAGDDILDTLYPGRVTPIDP